MVRQWVFWVVIGLVFGLGFQARAQKVAVVDSRKVLESLPEFKVAQEQLDSLRKVWKAEIDSLYRVIDEMWRRYRDERFLLTEQMRQKREEEIIAKERELRELKRKYFGPKGLLFQKQQELMESIQERVYQATRTVARRLRYGIVLDKASGPTVFFVENRYDITDKVIEELKKSQR